MRAFRPFTGLSLPLWHEPDRVSREVMRAASTFAGITVYADAHFGANLQRLER